MELNEADSVVVDKICQDRHKINPSQIIKEHRVFLVATVSSLVHLIGKFPSNWSIPCKLTSDCYASSYTVRIRHTPWLMYRDYK